MYFPLHNYIILTPFTYLVDKKYKILHFFKFFSMTNLIFHKKFRYVISKTQIDKPGKLS